MAPKQDVSMPTHDRKAFLKKGVPFILIIGTFTEEVVTSVLKGVLKAAETVNSVSV